MLDDSKNSIDYSAFTDEQIMEARVELWNLGLLEWKLDTTQKKLYHFFMGKTDKTIVINASRRLGKTYALMVIALETVLQNPNAIVKFIQPELGMIRKNVIDEVLMPILIDCPPELRPKFNKQDNTFIFPNGSKIQLAGTDNGNYDKIRGGSCHLAIVDEAGFCSDLSKILNYILIPTTLLTKGRIIFASTTPPNPDHEFIDYMEAAEAEDRLIRKTIFDAVQDGKESDSQRKITDEMVGAIIESYKKAGGVNSDAFRTEYLCEVIFNSDDAVLPEFTTEIQAKTVVYQARPAFADNYISMDIGFTDMTALLFAYYNYDTGAVVIEDELIVRGQQVTAKNVSELVKVKEDKLWTNVITGDVQRPYMRISDNNPIFLNELAVDYGCHFTATEKQNKATYITKLKTWIREERVIISPNCKTLLAHMKGATWDKNKKEYKRNTVDKHHYDFVDALVYLVRNIDEFKSPYPKGYQWSHLGNSDNVFYKESYYDNSTPDKYKKLTDQFKPKSSFTKKIDRDEQVTQFFRKKEKK